MTTQADKTPLEKTSSISSTDSSKKSGGDFTAYFSDNRPEAAAQKQLKKAANNASQSAQLKGFHEMTNNAKIDQGVVQRVIDTSISGMTPSANGVPNNAFTGLPNANKTVHNLQGTSSPADPIGMSTWKNKGYLKDPSKTNIQALTRMHAIRGRFGGPSAADNMFLGTALSNNFHSDSHYKQVELPLENYLKGGVKGEKRAFDYTVSPVFNSIPQYMSNRINNPKEVDPNDVIPFTNFADNNIPNGFDCTARLFSTPNGGQTQEKTVNQFVDTDVGATAQAPVSALNQVQAATSGITPGSKYASSWGPLGSLSVDILTGVAAGGLIAGPIGSVVGGLLGGIIGYATAEDD